MRAVSGHPETVCPRNDGSCAAFIFQIEIGEMGVNAAKGTRCFSCESEQRKEKGEAEKGERRLHKVGSLYKKQIEMYISDRWKTMLKKISRLIKSILTECRF